MDKHSLSKMGRPRFRNGEKRFACECGQHFYDGQIALAHALNGHDTVLEVYSMGRWVFRGGSVMDMLLNDMRKRGENIEDFIYRLEKLGDKMESEATVSAAETIIASE